MLNRLDRPAWAALPPDDKRHEELRVAVVTWRDRAVVCARDRSGSAASAATEAPTSAPVGSPAEEPTPAGSIPVDTGLGALAPTSTDDEQDLLGGDGGTRTLTGGVLSALPLPLGYVPGEPGLAQASILAHAVGAEGGVQPCSLLLHRRLEDLDDPPEALGLPS